MSFTEFSQAIQENVSQVIIGKGDVTEWMLVALLVERHMAVGRCPRYRQDDPGQGAGAEPRLLLRPDPVHAGPVAQQVWNRVAEPTVEYKVSPGQKE